MAFLIEEQGPQISKLGTGEGIGPSGSVHVMIVEKNGSGPVNCHAPNDDSPLGFGKTLPRSAACAAACTTSWSTRYMPHYDVAALGC